MVFVRTSSIFWKSVTSVSHFRHATSQMFECISDLINCLTKVTHVSAICLICSLNLWMFNGFATALSSEGHLRYFKAKKASEGYRFHKPDSQYHTEKHQKPTNLTKLLDVLTSQYPQHLILSIISEAAKSNKPTTHTLVDHKQKGGSPLTANIAYIVFPCLLFWKKANISFSVTLNALRFTNA